MASIIDQGYTLSEISRKKKKKEDEKNRSRIKKAKITKKRKRMRVRTAKKLLCIPINLQRSETS